MSSQCDLCWRQGKHLVLPQHHRVSLQIANSGVSCRQMPGDIKLNYFDAEGNMQAVAVEDLTKGKKVILSAFLRNLSSKATQSNKRSISHSKVMPVTMLCEVQPLFMLLQNPNIVRLHVAVKLLSFIIFSLQGCSHWRSWSFHPNMQLEASTWLP